MKDVLIITQVIFAILLSLTVLSQNRSAGLSAVFGGTSEFHASKRGAEKVLSNVTLSLVILFTVNSLAFLFI